MPVLEREPVRTCRERAQYRGEFHLNDPRTCAKLTGLDEFGRSEFQF